MSAIETERLILRRVTPGEARSLLAGEPPDGLAFAAGYPSRFTLEVMDLLAGARAGEADQFTPHFMIRRDGGEVIGELGWSFPQDEPALARIGYSIVEQAWNRGYGTEAVRGLIAHLLEDPDVEAVVADTMLDNIGSRRVMEKAGMTEAGTRLSVEDGETVELVRYEVRHPK